MQEVSVLVAAIGALSLSITKIVDLIRNLIDKTDKMPKFVWNVVALAVGLAMALGWQINIAGAIVALVPALAGHAANFTGTAGQVLTGVVIGMAAGFWHELLDSLSSIANRNNAVALEVDEGVMEDVGTAADA